MTGNLIIAPILLPAILAAVALFAPATNIVAARAASVLGTLGLLVIAILLMGQASTQAPQGYFLGDWPAPFGIVLVLDPLSALMVALLPLLALITLMHTHAHGVPGCLSRSGVRW